jgi:hypothetical protein
MAFDIEPVKIYNLQEEGGLREVDSDEEAQLLPIEALDYEDDSDPLPPPARRCSRLYRLLSGPEKAQLLFIKPILPKIQAAPIELVDNMLADRKYKVAILVTFLLIWAIAFATPLKNSLPIKDGRGEYVVNLDCVDTFWYFKNRCGLDGIDCEPFSNASFTFRCPGHCAGVQVWNPHAVGAEDVVYRPLVVGGDVYRGDSFICGSAIHAGIIGDSSGGCGRVSRIGERTGYPGTNRNGIESISFDSYFPLSFSFSTETTTDCGADPRGALLYISLFFSAVLSIFARSSWQFFILFTAIFLHVGLVSDPPGASSFNISVLPDHVSIVVARFLPAMFCAVVLYWTCIRRTLHCLEAQVEKTVLWLGGFWFGALSNYTFDWIPIQRLTAHDLERQPGAKVALAIIVILLCCIVMQQVYCFWLEKRLLRYLALYGLFISGILLCLAIPGLSLRIHHYVLALLLLPGTSLQTRPSLLYQGILLGLFVNGVARWGFDSILQTANDLRADGSFDSLLPAFGEPLISTVDGRASIDFTWAPPSASMDGVSVLVNEVERYRRFFVEGSGSRSFSWTRSMDLGVAEYFRFAYIRAGVALDYTGAGIWFANGTWSMTKTP